jgi:putative endonuclease
MDERFCVYILASRYRGTMYVGVTNSLSRRIGEHKAGCVPGFAKQYRITNLVYCERYASIDDARAREHILKRWRREWKFALIEAMNPSWRDLSSEIAD